MPGTNPLTPAPLARGDSETIQVARVFCILFMMTTHIWPGLEKVLVARAQSPDYGLFLVMDVLGRASVPLLSLFSGFLFFTSFARRGVRGVVASKFLTLIVPMVAWSLPMIAIAYGEAMLFGRDGTTPQTVMDWLNALFAITREPANGSLHFLRDIFIMALYGCVVLSLYRYSRMAALIAGIAIVLFEQIPSGGLVFRNTIATFYMAGILVAERQWISRTPSWPWVAIAVAVLVGARQFDLLYASDDIWTRRLSDHLPRVAATLLAWRLCHEIVVRTSMLKRAMLTLQPHIFTVFCSHQISVKGVAAVALLLHWHPGHAAYPAVFFGQLILCTAVGVGLSLLLAPFPLLRGKRPGRRARFPALAAAVA